MRLAPPTIVGALSVCSTNVRLKDQISGARVEVWRDGDAAPIGSAVATWPDELFDLVPGTQLSAGDVIRARQLFDGATSELSSDEVQVVDRAPSMPQFAEPLVACSEIAVLRGVVPGAVATIEDGTTASLGQEQSSGDRVVVRLNRPVGNGESLNARTDACGAGPKGTAQSLPAEPMAPPTGLRAPVLLDDPLVCLRLLHFTDTRVGATLVLERDSGPIVFTVSATELNARLDPPLEAGEVLTYWQEPPSVRRCDTQASPKTSRTVAAGPPPAPYVVTPPCPGSQSILVEGLVPSALVTVMSGATEVVSFEASASSSRVDVGGFTFPLGDLVTVTQSLCGVASPASPVPASVTAPLADGTPRLPEPLFECALAVRVEGVSAGSDVSVFSRSLGGRIGHAFALDDAVDVDVLALLRDDEITVRVEGCSGGEDTRTVEPLPDIAPFTVAVPTAGDTSVLVGDIVPGCLLDVLVDGRWAGGTTTGTRTVRVPVTAPLVAGDQVVVVARLCERRRLTQAVTVQAAAPLHWDQVTAGGIDVGDGGFCAGRVQAVLPLAAGSLLCGTEASGLWAIGAGGSAFPLSPDWPDPLVRCLALGPRGSQHVYCGTTTGLLESDPAQPVPLLSWTPVAGLGVVSPGPGNELADLLVLPGRNVLVIATDRGVRWSAIPSTPGVGYGWSSDPLVDTGAFGSLTAGPGESVVAYRRGAPGGAFFLGTWSPAGLLQWTETTPGAGGQAVADPRFTQIVLRMGEGALDSCPSDRTRVYAALHDTSDNGWLAVLRSDDGGATWSVPYPDPMLTQFKVGGGIDLGVQADRNLEVAVHPNDAGLVLLGSRRRGLLGSSDGGQTWDSGRWPELDVKVFHSDVLCVEFDGADPGGNTVVAGSDGGVFRSLDVGVTWDGTYNARFPTLMFDQRSESTAPALSASSAFPGLLVGALQDNGNVFLTQPGDSWQPLFDGGDGNRALFVTEDVVLRCGNDNVDLRWSRWDGARFSDPVAFEPPGFPANTLFIPYLNRVPDPRVVDPTGARMVAVAADDAPIAGTRNVYGLFDRGAGVVDDRFFWTTLGAVPTAPSGVGTLTGRVIIVAGTDHVYRLDPSTGVVVEMTLPAPPLPSNAVRWPTMAGGTVAFAVHGRTIIRTTNLLTWHTVGALPVSPATVEVVAVDRAQDPVLLVAAGVEGAWQSRDLGATWTPTTGLPRRPQATHLESVDTGAAGRWLHLGTWNWSAWRARLG